ncbi:hypothetical protein JCM19232_3189 [Vibrio ishigakensis]|uniref:Uncharacterized protein n=1 Tax=Vibrio ishigakensis TaxID=1481914 RepID=A0A0B8PF34_9VIBR|nr:hypothetical protein JCM19232_3189 [Vibrio ishigakensis]GAM71014.1 hypothetical protein JCM19236_1181 [Vibrio sp. JCM 19236]
MGGGFSMIFFNNLVIGYQNSPVTEAINGTITKASLTAS